jgi:putative hydrolase of the HAD superfamily
MIKAVIFDYGNVISLPVDGSAEKEMARLTGLSADFFMGGHEMHRSELDRGLISWVVLYERILREAGRDDLANDAVLIDKLTRLEMRSWKAVNHAVEDWVSELKREGYKIGILSNIPREALLEIARIVRPFQEAHYACFSCNIGLIKPDFAIYADVLGGLAVKPEEVVFFDDRLGNIAAAEKLGVHGILWTGLEEAKAVFTRFTVE